MNIKVSTDGKKINVVEESKVCKFADWGLREENIEDFVCDNIEMVFGDETSYLLVGRQVCDKEGKRNDLLAIDDEGSLVLIEIKRDADDIAHRQEPLEFQAIRYCSSLAMIDTPDDLVVRSYAKYIDKYDTEYKGDLSSHERGRKRLKEFLIQNNCVDEFNSKQRIILISSDYDKTTLSACAWLIKNGVDITLIKLTPLESSDGKKEIDISVVLPSKKESDYFVNLMENDEHFDSKQQRRIKRTNLPKMNWLMEQGIIKKGDKVYVVDHETEVATVIYSKQVNYNGQKISFNDFGCLITGWTTICVYEKLQIEGKSKTLSKLREEKMKELGMI